MKKAIAWDDLEIANDRDRYEQLTQLLGQDENVKLIVTDDLEKFYNEVATGGYLFCMIDCFDKGELVGPEIGQTVRDMSGDPAGNWYDPDFPIFLYSNEIDSVPVKDWDRLKAVPLEKETPRLTAFKIRRHLYPKGRWFTEGSLFLIHREASISESGQKINGDAIALVDAWCSAVGFKIDFIEQGDNFGREALAQLNDRILRSEKILAIVTQDEAIKNSGAFHARPNIYMELGMLGASHNAYVLRKTLVCLQEGVIFPSNYGGHIPASFGSSIGDVKEKLKGFLNNRPYLD